jgi:hypothetical protein
MPRRSVVLVKTVDPADEGEGLPAIGDMDEVLDMLSHFNTAPDGGKAGEGTEALGLIRAYGPGMYMEMMANEGEVRQVMVTMTDDDFAFPVLMRLCRAHHLTMLDTNTGQRLRF